jgi:hypothetical protein
MALTKPDSEVVTVWPDHQEWDELVTHPIVDKLQGEAMKHYCATRLRKVKYWLLQGVCAAVSSCFNISQVII